MYPSALAVAKVEHVCRTMYGMQLQCSAATYKCSGQGELHLWMRPAPAERDVDAFLYICIACVRAALGHFALLSPAFSPWGALMHLLLESRQWALACFCVCGVAVMAVSASGARGVCHVHQRSCFHCQHCSVLL